MNCSRRCFDASSPRAFHSHAIFGARRRRIAASRIGWYSASRHPVGAKKAAPSAGAKIIGLNNRNLKTLDVRIETSFELIEQIPDDCIAISESGIRTHEELARLRAAGFDGFLIGTSLMLAPDPAAVLADLLGTSFGAKPPEK